MGSAAGSHGFRGKTRGTGAGNRDDRRSAPRRTRSRIPGYLGWSVVLALALLAACDDGSPPATAGQPPRRIMPLGDSITQGSTQAASYRRDLWRLLLAQGLAVDFVGSQTEGRDGPLSPADFDPDHEGHWGWTAAQVRERIDGWVAGTRPDIVLLHLGTNDLGRGRVPADIVTDLSAIIAALRRANPRVAVLLAQVIPTAFPDHNLRLEAFNHEVVELAASLHQATAPVIGVDLFRALDPRQDLVDPVHPNDRGAAAMARTWLAAILALPAPDP